MKKLAAVLFDLGLSIVYLLAGAFLIGLVLSCALALFLAGWHAV